MARDSLIKKREVILHSLDCGILPYTQMSLPDKYDNHFSTIGVLGGHEACVAMLGKGIESDEGVTFMQDALEHIKAFLVKTQEETKTLWNLEATPAEGASYRLAVCVKNKYPETKLSGTEEAPYLTNSTNFNLSLLQDLWRALAHQEKLQPLYTGGTYSMYF